MMESSGISNRAKDSPYGSYRVSSAVVTVCDAAYGCWGHTHRRKP